MNFCGKDRYLYLRICTEMDNNAPNKPATKPHKAKMKHTYFAISFGGGRVILVLPICFCVEKWVHKEERDTSVSLRARAGKNRAKRRRALVWAEKKKIKIRGNVAPNFALERGEETALRVYSPRKSTNKHPTRVYTFTRCVFPRRVMRVLSNPPVVWSFFLSS